jgi:hypothetical protein
MQLGDKVPVACLDVDSVEACALRERCRLDVPVLNCSSSASLMSG